VEYFLTSNTGRKDLRGNESSPTRFYGRVLEVVLDSSTDVVDELTGKTMKLPIGSIQFRGITESKELKTNVNYAIPVNSNFKQLPLVNEIVEIFLGPTPDIQVTSSTVCFYYGAPLNMWGNPNHNAIPEPGFNPQKVLGDVHEYEGYRPLTFSPGDTILEGRLGQSIRLGGYKGELDKLSNTSNSDNGFISLTLSKHRPGSSSDRVEDINSDISSLYIVTDHSVPLKLSKTKFDSHEVKPILPESYRGSQILVNTGRVVINANQDSIINSTKNSFTVSAKDVNLDGESIICLDSKKIYLGKGAKNSPPTSKEPVVKGQQFENWINTLLDSLDGVANSMTQAVSVNGGPVNTLITEGATLKESVQTLRKSLKSLFSQKIFVE